MLRRLLLITVCLSLTVLTAVSTADQQGTEGQKAYKATLLAQKKNAKTAIATAPTSGVHCLGGSLISGNRMRDAAVHPLGFIAAGVVLKVNFESDFDPVAVVVGSQIGQGAPDSVSNLASVSDDDSGGNLEPKIQLTTPFDGSYVLMVGSTDYSVPGCYIYEVNIAGAVTSVSK